MPITEILQPVPAEMSSLTLAWEDKGAFWPNDEQEYSSFAKSKPHWVNSTSHDRMFCHQTLKVQQQYLIHCERMHKMTAAK